MHRGVVIDGEFVRASRKLIGWSQREFAKRAGVSERTVRNAERSMVVEVHIADYLAGALQKPLCEIITHRAESGRRKSWVRFVTKFDRAYAEAILRLNLEPLYEVTQPDVDWNCMTWPHRSFCGEFHGHIGLREHCSEVNRWIVSDKLGARHASFQWIRGEGEMLHVRGAAIFGSKSLSKSRFWIAKVMQLQDEKARSVDQYFGQEDQGVLLLPSPT